MLNKGTYSIHAGEVEVKFCVRVCLPKHQKSEFTLCPICTFVAANTLPWCSNLVVSSRSAPPFLGKERCVTRKIRRQVIRYIGIPLWFQKSTDKPEVAFQLTGARSSNWPGNSMTTKSRSSLFSRSFISQS